MNFNMAENFNTYNRYSAIGIIAGTDTNPNFNTEELPVFRHPAAANLNPSARNDVRNNATNRMINAARSNFPAQSSSETMKVDDACSDNDESNSEDDVPDSSAKVYDSSSGSEANQSSEGAPRSRSSSQKRFGSEDNVVQSDEGNCSEDEEECSDDENAGGLSSVKTFSVLVQAKKPILVFDDFTFALCKRNKPNISKSYIFRYVRYDGKLRRLEVVERDMEICRRIVDEHSITSGEDCDLKTFMKNCKCKPLDVILKFVHHFNQAEKRGGNLRVLTKMVKDKKFLK